MSDPIYCPAQTRPARMYQDPEPAEYCEEEVEQEGDYCARHEPEDDYNPWGDD